MSGSPPFTLVCLSGWLLSWGSQPLLTKRYTSHDTEMHRLFMRAEPRPRRIFLATLSSLFANQLSLRSRSSLLFIMERYIRDVDTLTILVDLESSRFPADLCLSRAPSNRCLVIRSATVDIAMGTKPVKIGRFRAGAFGRSPLSLSFSLTILINFN